MQAAEVIEIYVSDTVRLLPRRMRTDVANELRSLLNEELHARAEETGKAADETLALAIVRAQGAPNVVAARYQTPWTIIDAADSTNFMRAAIIGIGALTLFGGLSKRQPEWEKNADEFVKIGIFTWLGVLVVVFGVRSWIRRRWPKTALWRPHDRDQTNPTGTMFLLPVATFVILLYAAPAWMLDHLSGGRLDTSWAAYTDDVREERLPCFIGLMFSLLALITYVAIEGRWRRLTRRINIGLNLALALLSLLMAVDGNIFQAPGVDQIARQVLSMVAAVYLPCVGVMIYGEIGRLDPAPAANGAQVRQHS